MRHPFDQISVPERSGKPRDRGITMVLDQGLGPAGVRDLVATCGEYVDLVKLGYGTSRLTPPQVLEEKVAFLTDHGIDVCPGGTFLEIAALQDRVDRFLEACQEVGFTCVEVSDGVRPMSRDEKRGYIRAAVDAGFKVTSEVGRKTPEEDAKLSVKDRAADVVAEQEAGAWKIVMEARGSGTLGMFDSEGNVREAFVEDLLASVDPHEIIFEAPSKHQQVWLIEHLGSEVNVGNVSPDGCLPLEALRRGLRADTVEQFHGPG